MNHASSHRLPFRQVHLDFHTSPHIPGIGAAFDEKRFVDTLKKGHVNSVTMFATCHHGWSYYETKVGEMHPRLDFDLLSRQFKAVKAAGINAPIYLTAGVNNWASANHPEWREIGADGRYLGWAKDIVAPGFHSMCFNTPYLDLLCEQIREVAAAYPDCDGLFFDIISQGPCCCNRCLAAMEEKGCDAANEADRLKHADEVLELYYQRTTAAARELNPGMPVFHNSGHIPRGERDRLKYFSHLELESLPTGGWGYDHFPLSARYCANLGLDMLGMTGKFHTTWGEFGGYKHPNALRYECAAMLAMGAKCSVGDQLHPSGELDESTYGVIGAAYAEVEAKEAWCDQVENLADIGLLSSTAVNHSRERDTNSDTGAARMLLEEHLLFDVLDADMDFTPYSALILPDEVNVGPELKAKLDAYLAGGGRLILTGTSGLDPETGKPLWDLGAEFEGPSPFSPDFIQPKKEFAPDFCHSPMVMYHRSQRINATSGASLGDVYDPYFNRTFRHFCSHQHTPPKPEPSGYDCGVVHGPILYLAHPVFTLYAAYGAVVHRHFAAKAIREFLGDRLRLDINLPSTGRATLAHQPDERRYVLHLLFASPVSRGGSLELSGGTTRNNKPIQIIEDLTPLENIRANLRLPEAIQKVTLEPRGDEMEFRRENGTVSITVDRFTCHQMVVLAY